MKFEVTYLDVWCPVLTPFAERLPFPRRVRRHLCWRLTTRVCLRFVQLHGPVPVTHWLSHDNFTVSLEIRSYRFFRVITLFSNLFLVILGLFRFHRGFKISSFMSTKLASGIVV